MVSTDEVLFSRMWGSKLAASSREQRRTIMSPDFLDDFVMWYESTIEEYGADFLVPRPLLHLVVGIPPRLF